MREYFHHICLEIFVLKFLITSSSDSSISTSLGMSCPNLNSDAFVWISVGTATKRQDMSASDNTVNNPSKKIGFCLDQRLTMSFGTTRQTKAFQ